MKIRTDWKHGALMLACVATVVAGLSAQGRQNAPAPARPAAQAPATAAPARANQPPAAQPAAGPKVPMVEDVFKNVQVLKGISVTEFMDTMGFFSAAVGSNCVHCHVEESLTHWEKFAEDIPRKKRARQMVQMVNAINKANFGGAQVVTCYTCHHGDIRPEPIPSLLQQYSLPIEDPNKVEPVADAPKEPTADQLFTKYLNAIGGAAAAAKLTSFTAKGTYEGYDTYEEKVPFELFAKAPAQRTMAIHTQNGDITYVFNGTLGWLASIQSPVTLLPLVRGGDADAITLEAKLAFPANIKTALANWRVGFPPTAIDDKPAHIVQGFGPARTRFKLYFDDESGLLVRVLHYIPTVVGTVPVQTDYSDYKAVAGVKMPFKIVITYTDGLGTYEFSDIQPNANVDAAKFAEPKPAVVKSAVKQ